MKFKRLTSVLLSGMMMIGSAAVLPSYVSADENTEPSRVSQLEEGKVYTDSSGKYEYKLAVYHIYEECLVESSYVSHDSIQIVKYNGEKISGTYTLPDEIDGCPVGEVGKNAFKNQSFNKVIFHKGIKQINKKAFYNCKKLKTVDFKGTEAYEGLSFVGEEAFANCIKLSKLRVNNKQGIIFKKKALYNCKNLNTFNIDSDCELRSKALGFYRDKKTGKDKLVKDLKVKLNGTAFDALANTESYFYNCGVTWTANITKTDGVYGLYREGYTFKMLYNGEKPKSIISSNKKVIRVKNGKLYCLKTGKAKLTFTMKDNSEYVYKLDVGFMGGDSEYGDKFPDVVYIDKYKNRHNYDNDRGGKSCPEYLPIKAGKVLKLPIVGKVKSIKNKYKSSDKAKIISNPDDKVLRIKGLKKGKTSVKIRINGIKTIKIKLKIK
jgi:hypothetical protein